MQHSKAWSHADFVYNVYWVSEIWVTCEYGWTNTCQSKEWPNMGCTSIFWMVVPTHLRRTKHAHNLWHWLDDISHSYACWLIDLTELNHHGSCLPNCTRILFSFHIQTWVCCLRSECSIKLVLRKHHARSTIILQKSPFQNRGNQWNSHKTFLALVYCTFVPLSLSISKWKWKNKYKIT